MRFMWMEARATELVKEITERMKLKVIGRWSVLKESYLYQARSWHFARLELSRIIWYLEPLGWAYVYHERQLSSRAHLLHLWRRAFYRKPFTLCALFTAGARKVSGGWKTPKDRNNRNQSTTLPERNDCDEEQSLGKEAEGHPKCCK